MVATRVVWILLGELVRRLLRLLVPPVDVVLLRLNQKVLHRLLMDHVVVPQLRELALQIPLELQQLLLVKQLDRLVPVASRRQQDLVIMLLLLDSLFVLELALRFRLL